MGTNLCRALLGRKVDERDAIQRAVQVDGADDHVVERKRVVAGGVDVAVVDTHDGCGRDRDEREHVDGHICRRMQPIGG